MDKAVTRLEAADIAVVLKLLPHRYPFLMVDRVIDIRGDDHGVGIKNVTFNEPHFQGHFPDNPVFPGVLMIEGMAQTAGVLCIAKLFSAQPKSVYFLTIDKAKFRKPVLPGDTIEYHMTKIAQRRIMWWYRGDRQSGRTHRCRSGSRRHDFRRMSASMIDPSARIEATAVIGPNVTVGPYCTVGPHVTVGDGCRLVAHVNFTGHTSIGPRTVIHPFASLGSPPQSVHYRGGPTRLRGRRRLRHPRKRHHEHRHRRRRRRHARRRPLLFHGRSHVGHDCKVGSHVVAANNVLLAGHVSVGDHVVFGGGVAVRQFVRIGEGAMLVGLSGMRADVIPWGTAQGPLAHLVGLNVIGMRRHGFAKPDIQRYREAVRALFFAGGEFRARLERVAADYGKDELVGKLIAFIRAGKRPLTMAGRRGEAGRRGRMSAAPTCQYGSSARVDLRRRQPAFGGRAIPSPRRGRKVAAVSAARRRRPHDFARPAASLDVSRPSSANSCAHARAAGCRDVVLIGSLVRPSIWQMRPDFTTLDVHAAHRRGLSRRRRPSVVERRASCSTGQASACSARTRWRRKFWCPKARSAASSASERDRADVDLGLDYLRATGGFDVGQAVVVAGKHVLAVEAAEGTDGMLARVAEMRANGRVRAPGGTGVLVKAPKHGQDRRFDLPSIGPQTVEHAARARPCRHCRGGGLDDHRRAGTADIGGRPRQSVRHRRGGRERAMSARAGPTCVSGGRRGFRRPAGRGADRRHQASAARARGFPASAARRWPGRACLACFRSAISPSSALPPSRPACRRSWRAFGRPPTRSLPPSRTCWSSSIVPNSPIAWRGACARMRRRSPSSITFVRRCGRGGRDARAPCALTSIMCWRCCRSSRR